VWNSHQGRISLLLTDLIMPGGMSGLELARQLLERNPKLHVIYSSGYSAEIAGRELSIKAGVNYLGKPYELDTLLRTVRAALDGVASRSPFTVLGEAIE
jgi:CheY-like chemotaxis protein